MFIITILIFSVHPEATAAGQIRPDGPHGVGVRIVEMDGRDCRTPMMIWYPAEIEPGATPYVYPTEARGFAVFGAEVNREDGLFPLILFSHGIGACGCQSVFYTENLASHGYVVVAPDYRDSALCRIEGEPTLSFGEVIWAMIKSFGNIQKAVNELFHEHFSEVIGVDFSFRAIRAKQVIDQVLVWNRNPDFFLNALVDSERIGATGHSLGGYTSLMIGGMPFLCDQIPPSSDCDPEKNILERDACCNESIREMETPFELRDQRVKAIVCLGPAVIFPDIEGAARMEIPLMFITGGEERMEAPWEPIRALYDHAPPPKYLIRLKNTDHLTVYDGGGPFRNPVVRLFLPGYRSCYEDKVQAYKDYSAAFFDVYLKGKDDRDTVLKKPSNSFVELYSRVQELSSRKTSESPVSTAIE